MPWSGRSFMLDIKPQSEYANLFVECPENDDRDLIRILKNGVELCASPETVVNDIDGGGVNDDTVAAAAASLNGDVAAMKLDDSESMSNGCHHSLRACIKGFCLHPESVTNYAWTEDQHTFSCKLKVDFGDDDAAVKALKKKNSLNVEQFCTQMNKRTSNFECGKCGHSLQRGDAKLTLFPLPSADLADFSDDFFCHTHDHQTSDDVANGHAPNDLTPKRNQCLIGATYFVINSSLIDGACLVTEQSVLLCKSCHQQLGCLHSSGFNSNNTDAYRFYHVATNFYAKTDDNEKVERNFFDMRYESKERYFAWLLLSECESQSSLKFVVKTLDSHPKLLLWLLDSYSVIVAGKLDEENATESDQALSPCKPFPALKLMFKVLNDSSLSDPRVSGQDASVVCLNLPLESCDILNQYLEGNSESLPPACRHVGQFSVGFLHIGPEV